MRTNSFDFGLHIPISTGEVVVYESILSGNDLDSLEAYYNFKYINFADSEVMFQSSNLANLHGRTINSLPGGK